MIKVRKARGIQKGTMAWDEHSLALNSQVSRIAKKLKDDPQIKKAGITYKPKLPSNLVAGMAGCAPDGGIWFKNGELIAAFEAKKQGNRGNAIERWWKNAALLRELNQSLSYVTFAVGEGATSSGPIGKTLARGVRSLKQSNGRLKLTVEFDKMRIGKNSVFMKPSGFTDNEIESIMKKVLLLTPSKKKVMGIEWKRK